MDISEIPKYIRYDFFMALLGIIIAYFTFSTEIIYKNQLGRILFLVMSAACVVYGLLEMKNNYEREKELQIKEYEYRKKRIELKLSRLNKKDN